MAWRSNPSNPLAAPAQANDAGAREAARKLLETIVASEPGAAPGPIDSLVVAAGALRIAWRGDPARPAERFELRSKQHYLVASGAIVEGLVRSRRTAQANQGAPR